MKFEMAQVKVEKFGIVDVIATSASETTVPEVSLPPQMTPPA